MGKGRGAAGGTIVIGTIKGDIHDIGKNVVAALCTAHGYRVIDLGTDVPHNKFLETSVKESVDILALSTLLTTTLPYHREVVQLYVFRAFWTS